MRNIPDPKNNQKLLFGKTRRSRCFESREDAKKTNRDVVAVTAAADKGIGRLPKPFFVRKSRRPKHRAAPRGKQVTHHVHSPRGAREKFNTNTPMTMANVPMMVMIEGRSPRMGTASMTAKSGAAPSSAADRANPIRSTPRYRSIRAKVGANRPARTKGQAVQDRTGRIGEKAIANTHRKTALTPMETATAESGLDRSRPSRTMK